MTKAQRKAKRSGTVHAAPSRSEQAVTSATIRPHSRRCPTCRRAFVLEDREASERLLSIAEHPLIAHMRLHGQEGEHGGTPPLTDRFLNLLDHTPSEAARRRQFALDVAGAFADRYPNLASILASSLFAGRSNRQIAEELGLSHTTVNGMMDLGHARLKEVASGLYAQHS